MMLSYKDGVTRGKFRVYSVRGKLMATGEICNGVVTCPTLQTFHENGQLEFIGQYKRNLYATLTLNFL
jgi:antitoxin component YwqK of YwqJK toxin-antitoxin module